MDPVNPAHPATMWPLTNKPAAPCVCRDGMGLGACHTDCPNRPVNVAEGCDYGATPAPVTSEATAPCECPVGVLKRDYACHTDCPNRPRDENPAPAPVNDPVTRPHHYARFKIEPITFIMANDLPYAVGNVVKYICRFDAKNGDEDIRKAIRYCEMLLEQRKREREGTVTSCVDRPL